MAVETVNIRYSDAPPSVIGVLNITPDSFFDGGRFRALDDALVQAQKMVEDGVDIIDVGGESTRPGAAQISLAQELDRVLPVLEALHARFSIPVSIDTSRPEVMQTAIDLGVSMVNDVRALQLPGALDVVAASGVKVCLMHMHGAPETGYRPDDGDVEPLTSVKTFLLARIKACVEAGIAQERLILDPGFGFGKRLVDDLQMLDQLASFKLKGLPVLMGLSRKSTLGSVLGQVPSKDRLNASLAGAVIAAMNGAQYLRVHDVKETVEALKLYKAMVAYRD